MGAPLPGNRGRLSRSGRPRPDRIRTGVVQDREISGVRASETETTHPAMKRFLPDFLPLPRCLAAIALGSILYVLPLPLPLSLQTPARADDQSIESSLPQPAEDALKLGRAGLNEDLILAQIRSSGAGCQLTSDQILFLSNAGVSQNVIKALISGTAAAPAAESTASDQGNSGNAAPDEASAPGATPASNEAQPSYPQSLDGMVITFSPQGGNGRPEAPGANVYLARSGEASYAYAGGECVELGSTPGIIKGESASYAYEISGNVGNVHYFNHFIPQGRLPDGADTLTFTSASEGTMASFCGNSTGYGTFTISRYAAPNASAEPPQVSFDYFHDQLAPFGTWVQIPGYGSCWQPSVAAGDPNWRPYFDQGQWVCSDQGMYWNSYYTWGDIAFHYGRWFSSPGYGWLWVPDYNWGPSWVCWRDAEFAGCCGWAPLPPGVRFFPGRGLWYDGRLALDADFGLRWDAFVFVGFDHFWDRGYRAWMLPRSRIAFFYYRTSILNGYRFVGGRFFVGGLGRDRLLRLTHRDFRVEEVRDLRMRSEIAHSVARRVEAHRAEVRRADARRTDERRFSGREGMDHGMAGRADSNSRNRPEGRADYRNEGNRGSYGQPRNDQYRGASQSRGSSDNRGRQPSGESSRPAHPGQQKAPAKRPASSQPAKRPPQ